MITGDKPLKAAYVAGDVEIVDREALILDLKELHFDCYNSLWSFNIAQDTHKYVSITYSILLIAFICNNND